MNILITGGAGYIGSHAALRLLEDGHVVTIVDNMVRGNAGAVRSLEALAEPHQFQFLEADILDTAGLTDAMKARGVELVMHFAALTYVGESVEQPLLYYRNNTAGAISLLDACARAGVRKFVFSSTAATYGEPPPDRIPIRENCPQLPINPYGWSKLFVERILNDLAASIDHAVRFCALRYFNVAGADRKARIGEDHRPETHLIPICLEAALGQRPQVTVFGTDYDTPDGTCIRDYVHVVDLVDAHVAAMNVLKDGATNKGGCSYLNVGIGRGYSVREVVEAAQRVTGVNFKVVEGARRAGDPPSLYSDPSRIQAELGWHAAHRDLEVIIEDAWRWKKANPKGYR
jgi:UDP-glucose-4-epimerase GalE